MIPYISTRLLEWAEWSRMRIDGFYGASGSGQYDYEERVCARAAHAPPANLRCLETEEGVAWLRLESPRLASCVTLHYRDHPEYSGDMQAEVLRISRTTLWRYLDKSHWLLLGYFFDRAAGLCPQTEDLRLTRRKLVVADG